MSSLPKNAHVSRHPCLAAKLSQLRSASTSSQQVQTLVHEIALMVGYEALAAGLATRDDGTVSCNSLLTSIYYTSPRSLLAYPRTGYVLQH